MEVSVDDLSGQGTSKKPLSDSWRVEALSKSEREKVASILQACTDRDLSVLSSLAATKNGFVEDEIRRQACELSGRSWPILLGLGSDAVPGTAWKELPPHKDEAQVALDVNRAFVYYPQNGSEADLSSWRRALTDLITSVLRSHPSLSYFQGYHDIAQVLLLVLGLDSAQSALARLSLVKIRDFMLPTLAGTNHQLELLVPLLHVADPVLAKHLSGLRPYFALAAVLTMFAHDIEDYGGIARLFDYLISHEAVILIYMFAAIVTLRKDELLQIGDDEPEMLYAVLCKLPRSLDLEALIRRTEGLREMYPPERLPNHAWRRVSTFSVLKTATDLRETSRQRLADAEAWLRLHAEEIERQERRKATLRKMRRTALMYRKPASAVALAVLVGVISVWLGRDGHAASSSSHPIIRMASSVQQRVYLGFAKALGLRL